MSCIQIPGCPKQLEAVNVSRTARSVDKLTKHLPRSYDTVEVVEDCPRGRSQRILEFPPDGLGVDHRSNGLLVRGRSANTSNAKILEVYTELPPLDIGIKLPVNIGRQVPFPRS